MGFWVDVLVARSKRGLLGFYVVYDGPMTNVLIDRSKGSLVRVVMAL